MADTNYDKVKLLLPMSGVNNGTTFTDFEVTQKTVTPVGNVKTVTAQSKYYGSSAYFDGNGDYLTLADSADWNIASGDFTIECWAQFAANPTAYLGDYGVQLFGQGQSGISTRAFGLFVLGSSLGNCTILGEIYSGSTRYQAQATAQNLSLGTWYHFALCRSGSTLRLFMDGTQIASVSVTSVTVNNSTAGLFIASFDDTTYKYYLNGYMQDFRFTLGYARYASGFTAPGALIKTLSGNVKDDTNANATRTVRAYPRLTGLPKFETASASDGSWSLSVPDTEHDIVCLDDAAGTTYNDLIHRVVPG